MDIALLWTTQDDFYDCGSENFNISIRYLSYKFSGNEVLHTRIEDIDNEGFQSIIWWVWWTACGLVRLGVCSIRTHQQLKYSFTCDRANRHGGASLCIMRGVLLSMLLALPSRAVVWAFLLEVEEGEGWCPSLPHCHPPSPQDCLQFRRFHHSVLANSFLVDILIVVTQQPRHLLLKIVGDLKRHLQ